MNNRADRNLIKRRRPPTRQPALHRLHDPFPQIQRIRLPHSYWPPCSSQHLESHFNSRGNPNSDSARPDYALAARRIGATVAVLDGFCARMNEGLAAFAVALALLLVVTIVVQQTEAFLLPDAASGLATGD